MGHLFAIGNCYGCQRPFTFHPGLVPSVDAGAGRQPICRDCVALVNPMRVAEGLPEIRVLPGAYDPAPDGVQDDV